jgi:hypothetical protein
MGLPTDVVQSAIRMSWDASTDEDVCEQIVGIVRSIAPAVV